MAILLILLIVCCIYGIQLWNKRRIVSLLLFSPLLIVLSFVGFVIFNLLYHSNQDSLEFSVQNEDNKYTITGVWEKPLEYYRSSTDFIVFYLPNKNDISYVKRPRYKDVEKIYGNGLSGFIKNSVDQKNFSNYRPQIVDIKTAKKFTFSFELPENINLKDVKIYYAHGREDPMDMPVYWFKKIELK